MGIVLTAFNDFLSIGMIFDARSFMDMPGESKKV